jgi:hypothetical protein
LRLVTNEPVHLNRAKYAEKTTDDDILAAIRESEFPAVTAWWVADTLGIERPSAHRRLEELHEDVEFRRDSWTLAGAFDPRLCQKVNYRLMSSDKEKS